MCSTSRGEIECRIPTDGENPSREIPKSHVRPVPGELNLAMAAAGRCLEGGVMNDGTKGTKFWSVFVFCLPGRALKSLHK